jgi:hypothetical protein
LKVTDEKSRIRISKSVVRIRGLGSVPKCHGSRTLLVLLYVLAFYPKWGAVTRKINIAIYFETWEMSPLTSSQQPVTHKNNQMSQKIRRSSIKNRRNLANFKTANCKMLGESFPKNAWHFLRFFGTFLTSLILSKQKFVEVTKYERFFFQIRTEAQKS